jgi:hypothetical protein
VQAGRETRVKNPAEQRCGTPRDLATTERGRRASGVPRTGAAMLLLCAGLAAYVGCGESSSGGDDGNQGATGGTAGTTAGRSPAGGTAGRGGSSGAAPTAGNGNGGNGGTGNGGNGVGGGVAGSMNAGTTASGGESGAGSGTAGNGDSAGKSGAPTGGSSSGGQAGGGAGNAGSGGFTDCDPENCPDPFSCCEGRCINRSNDPFNCGQCGEVCGASAPFCGNGSCQMPPCEASGCSDQRCCFDDCCGDGELCCFVMGAQGFTGCIESVEGTCPRGRPGGGCLAPDTPIATPQGERSIAALRTGDLVFSVDDGELRVVRIAEVSKTRVVNHGVLQIAFDSGRSLEISPSHPLPDGRPSSEVIVGERLRGASVIGVMELPYRHPYTHDILPASESGTYIAAGVLIASTLKEVRGL